MPARHALTTAFAGAVIGAAVLALAGCAPEPTATSSSSLTVSASPGATSTAAVASPSPAATSAASLPASCEQLYSAGMLSTLNATLAPLNDPAIDLPATQVVPALEILRSGIPTLHCTWGAAGRPGLATNVSILTSDQASSVQDAVAANGFGCSDVAGGTLCTRQAQTVDFNDNVVTQGESQFLRGSTWVTTAWVGALPDGYTEDIAATLAR